MLHKHTELVLNSFKNVQPMKLGMHNQRCIAKNRGGYTRETRRRAASAEGASIEAFSPSPDD